MGENWTKAENEMNDYQLTENEKIIEFLKESRLFSHWPDELIQRLIPLSEFLDFPVGAEILKEGQLNDRVYFLVSGQVSVIAGEETILDLKRRGDIFGEMSVISNKPCTATIVVTSNTRVFSIKSRDIGAYSDTNSNELNNTLYRLFAMILTEKLSLTTLKARQFEDSKRRLLAENEERKKAEEKIKTALKEKETLLQEIHHRVKNNMQVINSLLKLQSNNIEDAQVKEILKDSQSRIYAMSAVHETLHGSENLSEIDLKAYLSKITTSIFQSYANDPQKVQLNSNIKESSISINQAYPLGLVINELISNSMKYAFPDDRTGEITVNMNKLENELELTVSDDGIGLTEGFDLKRINTLGLKLVLTLVEDQLDGSIEMESNNGTKFTIKFNIET